MENNPTCHYYNYESLDQELLKTPIEFCIKMLLDRSQLWNIHFESLDALRAYNKFSFIEVVRNFDEVVEVCKVHVDNLRSNVMKNAMLLVSEIFKKKEMATQILAVKTVSEPDFDRYTHLISILVNLMISKVTFEKSFIKKIATDSMQDVGINMAPLSVVYTLAFSKLNDKNNTIILAAVDLITYLFETLINTQFLNDQLQYVFSLFINLNDNPRQQIKQLIKKVCIDLEQKFDRNLDQMIHLGLSSENVDKLKRMNLESKVTKNPTANSSSFRNFMRETKKNFIKND